MATTLEVQQRLTQILIQVVDCAPDDVVRSARLNKDLGVDSLSIIEVCEKLGLDFDVYLSDEAINSMVTVGDAIDAVVRHDGAVGPIQSSARRSTEALFGNISDQELSEKKRHALVLAARMAVVGLAIGLVLAFAAVAIVRASGIDDIEVPRAAPTTAAPQTPTPKPSATPSASPPPTEETVAPAELTATPTMASPSQQIVLEGTFDEAGDNTTLQVQVKDPDTGWDDFPVTTQTGAGGEFRTIVRTTRPGERKFRLLDKKTDKSTPAVKVTIS